MRRPPWMYGDMGMQEVCVCVSVCVVRGVMMLCVRQTSELVMYGVQC